MKLPAVNSRLIYGLGEVDWCQMEGGAAVAMYGDNELFQMFKSADFYSAMV